MYVWEYLINVEDTADEQTLLRVLRETMCGEAYEGIMKAARVPVIGKILKALIALGESDSIAEFRQTEHYENIKFWNIKVVDLEKGHFQIQPSVEQWIKFGKITAVIVGFVAFLMWLCKKD